MVPFTLAYPAPDCPDISSLVAAFAVIPVKANAMQSLLKIDFSQQKLIQYYCNSIIQYFYSLIIQILRGYRLIQFGGWLFFLVLLASCKQPAVKKESWAVVINFFSPDTSYYPGIEKFPFPDSLQFAPLDSFFVNENKAPTINDSIIIFYENYRVNGEKVCCKEDTLELFVDTINGKKYLFAIGEYIAVFTSDTNLSVNLRARKIQSPILGWNVQLNVPYPPGRFKVEYEKLGAKYVKLDERIDEIYRQKWGDGDSIFVETIQFNNSDDRIITQVYKDMNEQEVDSTINYFRAKFPQMAYREVTQPQESGEQFRVIRMSLKGLVISIAQTSSTQYSFTMTDYFETIRLIIKNARAGYIFRDDVYVY